MTTAADTTATPVDAWKTVARKRRGRSSASKAAAASVESFAPLSSLGGKDDDEYSLISDSPSEDRWELTTQEHLETDEEENEDLEDDDETRETSGWAVVIRTANGGARVLGRGEHRPAGVAQRTTNAAKRRVEQTASYLAAAASASSVVTARSRRALLPSKNILQRRPAREVVEGFSSDEDLYLSAVLKADYERRARRSKREVISRNKRLAANQEQRRLAPDNTSGLCAL